MGRSVFFLGRSDGPVGGGSRVILTSFDSWPLAHHSFKVHAAFSTRFSGAEPKDDALREYLGLRENL